MRKYGIKIGGRGNTIEKTMEYINENGLQLEVFTELESIYKDFDNEFGTDLFTGFVLNYADDLYEAL